MSEEPIAISNLNDFIFCPVSIYFHSLEDGEDILTKDSYQLNGSNAHKKSDSATYYNKWLKQFDQTDSVYIFRMSSSCQIEKYGSARNEDSDLLIVN